MCKVNRPILLGQLALSHVSEDHEGALLPVERQYGKVRLDRHSRSILATVNGFEELGAFLQKMTKGLTCCGVAIDVDDFSPTQSIQLIGAVSVLPADGWIRRPSALTTKNLGISTAEECSSVEMTELSAANMRSLSLFRLRSPVLLSLTWHFMP